VHRRAHRRLAAAPDVTRSPVESISDILSPMKEKALAMEDASLDTASRAALGNDRRPVAPDRPGDRQFGLHRHQPPDRHGDAQRL